MALEFGFAFMKALDLGTFHDMIQKNDSVLHSIDFGHETCATLLMQQ